jgi:NAD(P)-dependent dehydrogenase (short-subunit alcohol dehydrogenase family)
MTDDGRSGGFTGVAALVTGASRGLGRALAEELARRGARVAMVARGRDALWAAAAEIERRGGEVLPIDADIGDARDVERIAAEVHDRLGALDLLIHNAATLGPTPLPMLLDLDPDGLLEPCASTWWGCTACRGGWWGRWCCAGGARSWR